jgi:hypothetical protein
MGIVLCAAIDKGGGQVPDPHFVDLTKYLKLTLALQFHSKFHFKAPI